MSRMPIKKQLLHVVRPKAGKEQQKNIGAASQIASNGSCSNQKLVTLRILLTEFPLMLLLLIVRPEALSKKTLLLAAKVRMAKRC